LPKEYEIGKDVSAIGFIRIPDDESIKSLKRSLESPQRRLRKRKVILSVTIDNKCTALLECKYRAKRFTIEGG